VQSIVNELYGACLTAKLGKPATQYFRESQEANANILLFSVKILVVRTKGRELVSF